MKRIALAIMTLALVASCDTGKEVLNLYRFAADQADSIYWKQSFGDKARVEFQK